MTLADLPARTQRLVYQASPLSRSAETITVEDGQTIAQMLDALQIGPTLRQSLIVDVGSQNVPLHLWPYARPRPGAVVYVRIRLQGGGDGDGEKNPLASILKFALIVVASFIPGAGILGVALRVGAIALGSALIDSLIPPPQQKNQYQFDASGNPYAQLTGLSNRMAPYAPIPRVFGKRRLYPMLAARPYTETAGDKQYLRLLLLVGYGPLRITDIRIGETPLSAFAGAESEIREGWDTDAPVSLFPRTVQEDSLSIQLVGPTTTGAQWNEWSGWGHEFDGSAWTTTPPAETGAGWVTRTSRIDATELSVDITFPQGVAEYDSSGARGNRTVQVQVQYRAAGTSGAWLTPTWIKQGGLPEGNGDGGILECRAAESRALVRTGRWAVPKGQYDVRVQRLTSPPTAKQVDATYWTALRTITDDPPINKPGLALVALRLQASEQLQGVPDSISVLAESYLPVWDGTEWDWQISRNPAWAYADVLRRRGTKTMMPDSRIGLDAVSEWASACEATAPNASEPRWACDIVIEGGSVADALRMIAASGRAQYTMVDGLYSVVRDTVQTVPIQHITPLNSSEYAWSRAWADPPHALRVRFPNAARNYASDERIVYMDGYSALNATKFDTLDLPACTSAAQAWREGRYYLAVMHLRGEKHRVTMDIEHLACTSGDLVLLQSDVVGFGRAAGRVTGRLVSGSHVVGIEIDEALTLPTGTSWGARFRRPDGSSLVATLTANDTLSRVLTLAAPIGIASAPDIGDLAMIGEATREASAMIVERIDPGDDLTAVVTMTSYHADIHTADTGPIPAWSSAATTIAPTVIPPPAAPLVTCVADETALQRLSDGTLIEQIAVNIRPAPGGAAPVERFDVQARPDGTLDWTGSGTAGADGGTAFIMGVAAGQVWNVRVRAVARDGQASPWATQTVTVIGKSLPPPSVTGFTATPAPGAVVLAWNASTDPDIAWHEIRVGASWDGGALVATQVPGLSLETTWNDTTSRVFWIKAVDTLGQYSSASVSASAAAQPVVADGLDPGATVDWATQIVGAGKPENNADVTASAVPSVYVSQSSLSVQCDHLGAVQDGQLPQALYAVRQRGGSDVSASTTWSIVDAVGCTASISSQGVVSLTTCASAGRFTVRSVRDGVTLDAVVMVARPNAAPPQTGTGGGTTVTDTSFAAVSGTSAVTVSDEMTVRTGAAGQIVLSAGITLTAASPWAAAAIFPVLARWQYRAAGSPTWIDAGAGEVESDPDALIVEDTEFSPSVFFPEAGSLTCNITLTGLSTATNYEVRLRARRSSASPAKTINLTGTASAVGS